MPHKHKLIQHCMTLEKALPYQFLIIQSHHNVSPTFDEYLCWNAFFLPSHIGSDTNIYSRIFFLNIDHAEVPRTLQDVPFVALSYNCLIFFPPYPRLRFTAWRLAVQNKLHPNSNFDILRLLPKLILNRWKWIEKMRFHFNLFQNKLHFYSLDG